MPKLSLNKPTVIALSTLLILGAGGASYAYYSNRDKDSSNTQSGQDENINYGPPTDQEKAETDAHKQELANQSADNPTNSIGQKNVKPIITSWGQSNGKVEVAGRVPGVLEEGGTCTLSLTKNGQTVTGTAQATPNVSDNSCGFIAVSRSKLSAGEWKATISYSSSRAHGTSETKTLSIL